MAAVIVSALISLVVTVALYIWVGLALSTVFRKTGDDEWKGWVPVLNTATLLQLGGFGWWWVLLLLIPGGSLAVYVVMVIACHRIGVRFGYGAGMTVLAALLFPVWASILAWRPNRWVSAREAAPRGGGPHRTGAPAPSSWLPPAPAGPSWHAAPSTPPLPRMPASAAAASPAPAVASAPVIASAPLGSAPSPAAPAPAPAPIRSAPASFAPAASAAPAAPPASATPPAFAAPAASAVPAGPAASAGPSAPVESIPTVSHPTVSDALFADLADDDDDDADPIDHLRVSRSAPFTGTVQIVPEATDDSQVGPRRAVVPAPEQTEDEPRADAWVRDVPVWNDAEPAGNPWAPPAPSAPAQVRPFDPTAFSDTSGEVSAVAGAPSLGVPMSARSSVSARRQAPELPDAEEAFDETIIAVRKRTPWMLVPPLGAPIPILQDVIIIGRRPTSDPAYPSAQLVSVVDETRTMSKTHARLELRDTLWIVTDLDSTNGVVIIDEDGTEIEAEPQRPLPIIEKFLLGDAELRFVRDGS
ncbi:FHA domain-containing protein [Microbacterium protaetiae]|uniref:FHA domain-containing protein n=1 Tax=Microbacterium protaetiae TaxID=2509458 RepID=A0A4P6EQU2_9MICO|nr:DUF5684 domain-containing protein [Microbacterium protaetiae]QAY60238.1 FHA domain-containing protein [Microbacterium protaetiae]